MNDINMPSVSADQIDWELLKAGIEKANVPTLLMCLVQLTGDKAWLEDPYRPKRGRGLDDNDGGGLEEHLQQEVRIAAYDAIVSWFNEAPLRLARPTNTVLAEMLSVAMDENVPAEYGDIIASGMHLDTEPPVSQTDRKRTAIIIGGGVSGICAAIEMNKMGIEYQIFEKNEEFGGTWWENRYPGCGVDTPNLTYTFSFRPNDWSKYFPLRDEIKNYLLETAREYKLYERTNFGIVVKSTEWLENEKQWKVTTVDRAGNVHLHHADLIFSAVGLLNTPQMPEIPGLQSFPGKIVHTCQWPENLDFVDKRVAVIGNGASAMQVVPAIADSVANLTIFARSKQWAAPFPQFQKEIPSEIRYLMQVVPLYRAWFEQRLSWTFNDRVLGTLVKDPSWDNPARSVNAINDGHREFFTRYVQEELGDREDLLPKVLPSFPPFAKRMLLDNGWYRTLRKEHVSLIPERLASIDGSTLTSVSGEQMEADLIIFATGYQTTHILGSYDVIGQEGRILSEFWDEDDAAAFCGTLVPGFPNFFILLGPNVGSGHGGSMIRNIENQVHFAGKIIEKLNENNADYVQVRDTVYEDYKSQIDEAHEKLVWTHPGTENWYRNSRGRVVAITPWRNDTFWRMTRSINTEDIVFNE